MYKYEAKIPLPCCQIGTQSLHSRDYHLLGVAFYIQKATYMSHSHLYVQYGGEVTIWSHIVALLFAVDALFILHTVNDLINCFTLKKPHSLSM